MAPLANVGPIVAFALALPVLGAFAQDVGERKEEWNFMVTIDGKSIGTHRFVVSGSSGTRDVDSRADLVVRMLGIPVYHYRHQAEEHWQGDCLRELRADTDDDGQRQKVAQRFAEPACLMSFAYWNPKLIEQHQLVDPQTGQATPVRFDRLAQGSIELRDRTVAARGWLLLADRQRITIWYAADSGRWIGLDAETKGGHRLRYRIPTENDRP